jgi:hypothetical protein
MKLDLEECGGRGRSRINTIIYCFNYTFNKLLCLGVTISVTKKVSPPIAADKVLARASFPILQVPISLESNITSEHRILRMRVSLGFLTPRGRDFLSIIDIVSANIYQNKKTEIKEQLSCQLNSQSQSPSLALPTSSEQSALSDR